MRVAVIGTGIMGTGMAHSLQRAGHDVVAWNRTGSRAEPLRADGIAIADSVAAAMTGADAVITVLYDTAATLGVCDELVANLSPDAVWLQSATVGRAGMDEIAQRAGRDVLDAPVLGTKKPAEEGTLTVLASGPAALLDRAEPVVEAIGARTVPVSERIGDASALKLVCNAWIGLITAGTAQSLAFAERLDLDPSLFLQAISGAPTDSPYAQLKGKQILSGDYTTSFAVDGVVKDVGLMLDAARAADFPVELLTAVQQVFRRASAAGHGTDDMAAARFGFPR